VAKRTVFMAKMRDSYEVLDRKLESQISYLPRQVEELCSNKRNSFKTKIILNYIQRLSSYAIPGRTNILIRLTSLLML
jgi:hypothetical protein